MVPNLFFTFVSNDKYFCLFLSYGVWLFSVFKLHITRGFYIFFSFFEKKNPTLHLDPTMHNVKLSLYLSLSSRLLRSVSEISFSGSKLGFMSRSHQSQSLRLSFNLARTLFPSLVWYSVFALFLVWFVFLYIFLLSIYFSFVFFFAGGANVLFALYYSVKILFCFVFFCFVLKKFFFFCIVVDFGFVFHVWHAASEFAKNRWKIHFRGSFFSSHVLVIVGRLSFFYFLCGSSVCKLRFCVLCIIYFCSCLHNAFLLQYSFWVFPSLPVHRLY